LQLDPENIQGLHNLCVVYVERGNLLRAEACLTRAHRLAPNEDYVLRHLNIVQSRINKLQIPRSSEEGGDFEDFGVTDDFQRYEENFDDDNLEGDFDDELGPENLEGIDEFGRDIAYSQNHKASLRKSYLVEKEEDSSVLDDKALGFSDSRLHKQKSSETRFTRTVKASPVKSDYAEETPDLMREDTQERKYGLPQEAQHSSVTSHQTNRKSKPHPSSPDAVFSNNPSSGVKIRQEEKSPKTIFSDSLKKESQRKMLVSHNELNKHSSS